jgi:arylsulfatase
VNGTPQTPIAGVSLAYTFADPKAPSRHTTQYFEIFGNRAIYHDSWLAGTVDRAPREFKPRTTLDNDPWELYDTRTDFNLANDLAAKHPEKLKELQDLFLVMHEVVHETFVLKTGKMYTDKRDFGGIEALYAGTVKLPLRGR